MPDSRRCDVSDVTGFPEMMDGRVKTLHPAVHGGLLARRDVPEHMAALAEHKIAPIDLVAVNLYPFRETVARKNVTPEQAIENIDIGGPSMLRSAAKNFESVWVVADPNDYPRVLVGAPRQRRRRAISAGCSPARSTRTRRRTTRAIAAWFATQRDDKFPETIVVSFERAQSLRYGENPGQAAAFYTERPGAGLAALKQRGGKELSFNNLLDLEGALLAIDPFARQTACAIVKHTTPCGLATGTSPLDAYRKALACDPVSAFGSVIAFTVPVDDATADAVSGLFVECIVAPSFSDGAVEILGRKKNLRVLEGRAAWGSGQRHDEPRLQARARRRARPGARAGRHRRRRLEGRDEARSRPPRSTATCCSRGARWRPSNRTRSCSCATGRRSASAPGQMSRVDAAFLAVHKAQTAGHETAGCGAGLGRVLPLPRRRGPSGRRRGTRPSSSRAARCGTPRSSRRRTSADIAMVFTGKRQFRH